MKDNEKQEKAKMVNEVADDKTVEGKYAAKDKKGKVSKGKGTKDWKDDEVIELIEERPSL